MATVKKTPTKKAVRKTAARKAPAKKAPEVDVDAIVAKAVEASVAATAQLITQSLAKLQAQTAPQPPELPSSPEHSPGGRKVEAAVEVRTVTREEYARMDDDEKARYNNAQAQKVAERKKQADQNRADMMSMPRGQRIKMLMADRDPNIIRQADNPLGEETVQVVCLRKVGLNNFETSDVGEKVILPLTAARNLQDSGAIRVAI